MFSFSLQIDIVTTDTVDVHSSNKDEKDEPGTTSLLLRMGPHRCENLPDILVECAINHPFFVKDKGQFSTIYTSELNLNSYLWLWGKVLNHNDLLFVRTCKQSSEVPST